MGITLSLLTLAFDASSQAGKVTDAAGSAIGSVASGCQSLGDKIEDIGNTNKKEKFDMEHNKIVQRSDDIKRKYDKQ